MTSDYTPAILVLLGLIMYGGGPTFSLTNWSIVGALSVVVSMVMAAALSTAGDIYFWSYRLG